VVSPLRNFILCQLSILIFFRKQVQIYCICSILTLLIFFRIFFTSELNSFNFILEARLLCEFGPFFFLGTLLALLKIEHIKRRSVGANSFGILITYHSVFRLFLSFQIFYTSPTCCSNRLRGHRANCAMGRKSWRHFLWNLHL
jgi:hypothetical protein